MKALFSVMFFLLVVSLLWGAPLRDIPTELTQPDGTTFKCLMSGDEYYHRYHDQNGFTIIQNTQTGWFVYALKQEQDLSPSEFRAGIDNPTAMGLTPNLLPDKSILSQKAVMMRGEDGKNFGRAPTTGSVNSLCIFIRFSDQTEFTDALSYYNDMHNATNMASLNGFFLEDSNNQLNVSTTFYPTPPGTTVLSYQSAFPRYYYQPQVGGNNGYTTDVMGYTRLHMLLNNAVNSIAHLIPAHLNLDVDSNGSIDNLSFVCRGNADGLGILWPHTWVLDQFLAPNNVFIPSQGISLQADDYNFLPQMNDPGFGGGGIDTAIICHEFSHSLGFPDLYHYIDSLQPCGWWDLMDMCQGTPQHHLTYMKWKYGGWFTNPPILPAVGTQTLNAVVYNPFDCYMYQLPTGEQIWMEFRRNVGTYESRLPGSGLIIYIVNPSMTGNGYVNDPTYPGLIDEVYVYRPYCTPGWPDGNISWAHYAWEQSHTAINQFTDPKPFSISNSGFIANLNIYKIGSNTGPQITFEVGTVIPVIWTGAYDSNWYNANNWTTGTVPIATDFVIIDQGMQTCNVTPNPAPAVCNNIWIENQINLLPGANLLVSSSLNSIGRIIMDGNLLQVTGDLIIKDFYQTPWFHCNTNGAAQIQVGGNCLFDNNTNIQLTAGTLVFANIGLSPPVNTFTLDAFGTVLNNVIVSKTGTALNYDSFKVFLIPTMILGSLSVTANSTFYINSPQSLILDGNLNVDPAGTLNANMGTIILTANAGPQVVNIANPFSFLNDVELSNNTGTNTNLANNLTIKGNLTLNFGILSANTHTIFLHGNWNNNIGLGAFQKGTSHVVFQGNANQYITVTGNTGPPVESFYILELANPANSLIMNAIGQQVQCDFYDWTSGTLFVSDGSFTAWSLLDNCIAGNIVCNGAGAIFLHDMTGNADLAANLFIHGGNVTIVSGNPNPGNYSTWGLYNGSLTMDSGVLNFSNTGVWVYPMGGIFTSTIIGGMIYVNGDFDARSPGFNPIGGRVVINGSNPVNVAASGGANFYELQLSASTVTTIDTIELTGMLDVDIPCNFNVFHNINASAGTMSINGAMHVSPLAIVSATVFTINGTVNMSGGAILEINNDIDVNGTLSCQGAPGNSVIIRGSGRSYWKMHVMGTLSANYTDFSKLREEGIWVMTQGNIDQASGFDNNSFTDGAGNTTFLTFANPQNLTINGIDFSSSSGAVYNIAQTTNSGTITINNATGSFSGPLYENDTYGLINWIGFDPNLIITAFAAIDPNPYLLDYVSYSITIYNDSDLPVQNGFYVHFFQDRASAPGWNESGDSSFYISSMSGHESLDFTISGYYSSSVSLWTSWLLIDPEDSVTETNEYDNLASTNVTWNALPAIPTVGISNTGSNTARITWTYPIWADEFEVFDDSDPYGSFTNSLGTTSNLYKDVSTSNVQRFYLVKAIRNYPR